MPSSLNAPFRSRPNAVAALGFAVARISPRLRDFRSYLGAATGVAFPSPTIEAIVEASYLIRLNDRLYLQPNSQFTMHPSAELLADPATDDAIHGNAAIGGLRTAPRL